MLWRLKMVVSRIAYASNEELRAFPVLERSLLPVLEFGSLLFKTLLFLRQKLYQRNVLKTVRLPVPVISIGNISWGGNGKTPMVEYLSWKFLQCGIPPLILTRGYASGDEAILLENHLHGTGALVGKGPNRVEIATMLLCRYSPMDTSDILDLVSKLGSNALSTSLQLDQQESMSRGTGKSIGVIFLDDGMQHWKIRRDVEIVMVNALSLFGNERLIPRGPLREPLDALNRADILVIHHANLVPREHLEFIKAKIRPFLHCDAVILCSKMLPCKLIQVPSLLSDSQRNHRSFFWMSADRSISLDVLRGEYVVCVSGIGCPESLSLTLEQLGAVCLERMDFPDHHHFKSKDISMIQKKLCMFQSKLGSSPLVIITEKDYARNPQMFSGLHGFCNVFALHSRLELEDDLEMSVDLNAFIAEKIRRWKLH